MSVKKFKLEKVGEEVEDGYPWDIVECPECGEEVQRRNIEDDGRWFHDDYREDVCPECDEEINVESESEGIDIPVINDYGTPEE
ncbi:hypothetical protein [Halopiger thermotolerans]